ncbi:hypothetical protein [Cellulomonas xiejunii]|uniref:hypothetical protein n=1 Tax=Cellulomonas xiejunii TaxID=2968083 RepID=UPI001D0E87EC|nr:hypothetical protein [Cellulomonas xiejunii]MCC2313474.1 hypothetical protein [Cellulomonas xiejunii]
MTTPPGEPSRTAEQLRALLSLPMPDDALRELSSLAFLGGPFAEIAELHSKRERLIRDGAANLDALGRRGWGVTGLPVPDLTHARKLLNEGHPDRADELLADLWDDDERTGRVVARVRGLGAQDPALRELSNHRRRLLARARDHHHAGAYEASVPLVLAQVEGITADVTGGKLFFSKTGKAADLEDLSRFVSLTAGLPSVRQVYIADVKTTQAAGALSRHGILHGRELAFDTKVVSAKVWSMLADVVEWATPLAATIAQTRVDERRAARAGSNEVNARGQRLDDREFFQTRETLRWLSVVQLGQHRNTGRFHPDLITGWRLTNADFTRRRLPEAHGVESRVTREGQQWWAWRTTVSGWVLGVGLEADGGRFVERMYAGSVPPPEGPGGLDRWAPAWETPADWTSLDHA